MRDVVKGAVALMFLITLAGVALAFMKPSTHAASIAPDHPGRLQTAEAAWTAQRDKLRSECMGGQNADALPPALFKQLLDSCDRQVADEMGPKDYWVAEEAKLQASEAQRAAHSHDERGHPTGTQPAT